MNMNDDFDYMKNRFDNDGLRAPDRLSEEQMNQLLETSDKKDSRARKRPFWRRGLAAAAACLVLAVLLIPIAADQITDIGSGPDHSLRSGTSENGLETFENYSEIEKIMKKLNSDEGSIWSGTSNSEAVPETADSAQGTRDVLAVSTEAAGDEGAGAVNAESYSDTYLQVEEVDEADIIKTDGRYIYYVNDNAEVVILSAANGETEKVSVIGNGEVENYIHDIYLKGDRLITVGVTYENEEGWSSVVTYDISDRTAPKAMNTFRQSGDIVSSRMTGDIVYLVTCEYMYGTDRIVPMTGENEIYAEMAPENIWCVPDPETPSYVILSAVDTGSGESESAENKLSAESGERTDGTSFENRSIAVLGASQTIYCNQENLYAAVTEYSSDYSRANTRIMRASLEGTNIAFEASGQVAGTVYDQFAMDEKDGYFRIATTAVRDGIDVNDLLILDMNLEEVGSVTGFARNESIRAVRYIGDKAYVITFEQVDPLFVIDLSDPSHPSIDGEVQIEGFSSLLVPIAENRLLGIGYLTADNGYGGVYTDGLKLALFDISNPAEPQLLDSREFQGMYSPAQTTHLALTVNSEKGYYAVPYGRYPTAVYDSGSEYTNDSYTGGVLVFGAGDTIEVYDEHALAVEELRRNVYIGDWIYAFSGGAAVYSFPYPVGE